MSQKNSADFIKLKNLWLKRHSRIRRQLGINHKDSLSWLENSSKHLVAGSLGGLLLLSHPTHSALLTQSMQAAPTSEVMVSSALAKKQQFLDALSKVLPSDVRSLSMQDEQNVLQTLVKYFNLPIKAEIEGKRMNRNYGLIGAEQHLMRYPGDTMAAHFADSSELRFTSSGMAPGRGAWGYFTESRSTLTQKDIDREKYYIAVQTFLSPGYLDRVREYSQFFKYRKVLVVNPENGKSIVVVIGDAGPGRSTGKHLGGSPEVMDYLERQDGRAKGPVLYFFIDDPEDTVPLGPIAIE